VTIYDPKTGAPIAGDNLANASTPISAQALTLLNYYPAPNIVTADPTAYNYQTISNAGSNNIAVNARLVRTIGQSTGGPFGRFGGGGGGRGNSNAKPTLRQNVNVGFNYSHSASDVRNIFLPLGGTTGSEGYGISAGYTIGYGRLTNNASINWNRSHAATQNYFTNGSINPGAQAGVLVGDSTIQSNQFYYGVPTLSFGGSNAFTGLNNTAPNNSINQTISFSDFVSYSHKKHNMRYGVDIRRVHADTALVRGPEPIAKALNDMVGRNPHMSSTTLE